MVPQKNLELIEKEARRIQELARDLKVAESAREAQRIRREMARLSKEIEEASRADNGHDGAISATG